MITIDSLCFNLEDRCVFKNIMITFLPSAIVLLQGKNGSGKTSLLRMLARIQQPSSGQILFGTKQQPVSFLSKPYCTYIGHNIGVKNELTVLDNIKYWANIFRSETLIGAAIQYFNLHSVLDAKCSHLSEGNKKRVALSRLIVCPSKLWLLDEIDTNLDESNKELLMKLIVTHADNGGLVFLASHTEPPIKTIQTLDLNHYCFNK